MVLAEKPQLFVAKYTKEQCDEILSLHYAKFNTTQITRLFNQKFNTNISRGAVCGKLSRLLGHTVSSRRARTEKDNELLRDLYPRFSRRYVAERMKRPLSTVDKWATDLGLTYTREEWLTYGDFANLMGRSTKWVQRKVNRGLIKTYRYDELSHPRITYAEAKRFMLTYPDEMSRTPIDFTLVLDILGVSRPNNYITQVDTGCKLELD